MEILIYIDHIHMIIKYLYLLSFMWIFHFQNHCVLCHTTQTQEKHIPHRNYLLHRKWKRIHEQLYVVSEVLRNRSVHLDRFSFKERKMNFILINVSWIKFLNLRVHGPHCIQEQFETTTITTYNYSEVLWSSITTET